MLNNIDQNKLKPSSSDIFHLINRGCQSSLIATPFIQIVNQESSFDKIVRVFKPAFRLFLGVILSLLFVINAWGTDFSHCSQHFYAGSEPDYIDDKVTLKSAPLCFRGFATLYSGISRTPLWSAEHLTRERLNLADELPREDSFHSESRLPNTIRAQLSDYKHSEYDRGHLAPNADMADAQQQYESFSLANIIPQHPTNNRYIWRNIESVTRYLTKKHGELYVISGVAFKGERLIQLNNRVLVPSHTFKAIYIPATGKAAAYFAPNDGSERLEVISIDELALRSGIDVFPAISSEAKALPMRLPASVGEITGRNRGYNNDSETNEEPLWYLVLVEVLSWLAGKLSSAVS